MDRASVPNVSRPSFIPSCATSDGDGVRVSAVRAADTRRRQAGPLRRGEDTGRRTDKHTYTRKAASYTPAGGGAVLAFFLFIVLVAQWLPLSTRDV